MKKDFLVDSVIKLILLVLLLSPTSCKQQQQTKQKIKQPEQKSQQQGEPEVSGTTSEPEDRLVINQATLEEVNDNGQTVWKMKADKTSYNEDKKFAQLENPAGNLYQDGKIVLQVEAKKGEIQQDGKIIILREKVVATDIRNKMVLRCDELEWRPTEDLLLVRKNLTGSRPQQLEASATEGRYSPKKQQLDLLGQVTATTNDPPLQMKTEHLIWKIPEEKVIGNNNIQIDQYKKNTITERIEADKSQLDLKTKIVILTNNAELKSLDPPLQIASNSVIWNTKAKTVQSNKPVQIVHSRDEIAITANEGIVDLDKEVARLNNGVKGVNNRNKSQLDANQMVWDIPTQMVEATGNVVLKRTNPPTSTFGVRAVGQLNRENIVVTGGNTEKRVETKIIP